jgi:hypothetical protein
LDRPPAEAVAGREDEPDMSKKVRRGLAAMAVAGIAIGGTAMAAEAYPKQPRQPLPHGAAGYVWHCKYPGGPVEVVTASVAPSRVYCKLVCAQLPCFVAGPLPPKQFQVFSL